MRNTTNVAERETGNANKLTMYMQLDGVEGEVTSKSHQNWIKIDSLHFGAKRSMTNESGNTTNRESTRPVISEVTFTKPLDKTSPNLFVESVKGKAKKTLTIDVCQAGDNEEAYMQYIFTNPIISGVEVLAAPHQGGRPMETYTVNFTKVEMRYTPYDEQNKAQSPTSTSFDLVQAA